MGRPRATLCKVCGSPRQAKSEALCKRCLGRVRANRDRKRWYKITPDQYQEMMLLQGQRCAICRQRLGGRLSPKVDHDHRTGEVRGILCNGCNVGLGHFGDNVVFLTSAISYLSRFVRDSDEDKAETGSSKIKKSDDKATKKRKQG